MNTQRVKGFGGRFDKGQGDYIENIRKGTIGLGLYLPFGKRFCETCQQAKPADKKTKAYKGWKCDDCKNSKTQ